MSTVRKTKLFVPATDLERQLDAVAVVALRVKCERDILFQACIDVVGWYENSGLTDPVDSVTAWRICRKALTEVRKLKAEKS